MGPLPRDGDKQPSEGDWPLKTRTTGILILGLATLRALSGCGSGDSASGDSGVPAVDGAIPETGMSMGPDTGLPDVVGGDSARSDASADGAALHDAQPSDATASQADSTSPDGPHTCHNNSDCSSSSGFLFCSPGGTPVGCGTCQASQAPCNMDSECQQIHDSAASMTMVCGPAGPCTCPSPGKTGSCIPACAATFDCSPGLVCQSGHCSPRPCSTDSDCPPVGIQDYRCGGGQCSPKACASDADCHGGYCINSACSSQPGACAQGAA